jgi:hypothetical protein
MKPSTKQARVYAERTAPCMPLIYAAAICAVALVIGSTAANAESLSSAPEAMSVEEASMSVGPAVGLESPRLLGDQDLGHIRGRFVEVPSVDVNGVILWDERPGRGVGGSGSGSRDHRVSSGLNNTQSVNVFSQWD